jgi:hypothetical protein
VAQVIVRQRRRQYIDLSDDSNSDNGDGDVNQSCEGTPPSDHDKWVQQARHRATTMTWKAKDSAEQAALVGK